MFAQLMWVKNNRLPTIAKFYQPTDPGTFRLSEACRLRGLFFGAKRQPKDMFNWCDMLIMFLCRETIVFAIGYGVSCKLLRMGKAQYLQYRLWLLWTSVNKPKELVFWYLLMSFAKWNRCGPNFPSTCNIPKCPTAKPHVCRQHRHWWHVLMWLGQNSYKKSIERVSSQSSWTNQMELKERTHHLSATGHHFIHCIHVV